MSPSCSCWRRTPRRRPRRLLKRGVGAVLLTRGRRGCLLVREQGSISCSVPEALRSTPVDTTGAGDAFLGALAHLIASGSTEAALPGAVEIDLRAARRLVPDRRGSGVGETAAGAALADRFGDATAVGSWCSRGRYRSGRPVCGLWERRRHRLRFDRRPLCSVDSRTAASGALRM